MSNLLKKVSLVLLLSAAVPSSLQANFLSKAAAEAPAIVKALAITAASGITGASLESLMQYRELKRANLLNDVRKHQLVGAMVLTGLGATAMEGGKIDAKTVGTGVVAALGSRIGATIGNVLGNKSGKKHGQEAGSVLGYMLGGAVGPVLVKKAIKSFSSLLLSSIPCCY